MTHTSADRVTELALREWGPSAVVLPEGETAAHSAITLEPDSPAMAAAMLHWASGEGVPLVPRGSGTKLVGPIPITQAVLSTKRLTSGVEHRAGDLTATVPAGTTLDALNNLLGRERQWLPLDPAG